MNSQNFQNGMAQIRQGYQDMSNPQGYQDSASQYRNNLQGITPPSSVQNPFTMPGSFSGMLTGGNFAPGQEESYMNKNQGMASQQRLDQSVMNPFTQYGGFSSMITGSPAAPQPGRFRNQTLSKERFGDNTNQSYAPQSWR